MQQLGNVLLTHAANNIEPDHELTMEQDGRIDLCFQEKARHLLEKVGKALLPLLEAI